MSIKTGDTVKVITKNSRYEGMTGKVIYVYEDEKTCNIQLMDKAEDASGFEYVGVTTGFFVRELEILPPEGTGQVDVRLSAEDDYTVTLTLTPEEKRGIEKLVAAAKEIRDEGHHPFAPDIEIRKAK